MLSVTVNSDLAKEKYASRWEQPVLVNIIGSDDIPSVLISDVLPMTEDKDERIISPLGILEIFIFRTFSIFLLKLGPLSVWCHPQNRGTS